MKPVFNNIQEDLIRLIDVCATGERTLKYIVLEPDEFKELGIEEPGNGVHLFMGERLVSKERYLEDLRQSLLKD